MSDDEPPDAEMDSGLGIDLDSSWRESGEEPLEPLDGDNPGLDIDIDGLGSPR